MDVVQVASRYRWVILGLGFLGQFTNSLAFQSVAPLAPLFQPELGLNKAEVGLFSSILFAGQWALLLVAGTLTDRFGVKITMAVGLAVIGSSLIFMGQASTFQQALLVMFAAGVGSSGVLPAVTKAIVDWFPSRVWGTVMGMKQAAVPVGGVVTAALLPSVALALGWRNAIAGVGLVSIVCAAATILYYRDVPCSSVASAQKESMRDGLGAVLRNRRLWQLSLVSVLFVSVQLALTTYLALYFEENVLASVVSDKNTRVVASGGFLAVCQLGGAIGRVFWGALSDRVFYGRRMVVLMITGALTVACSIVTSQFSAAFPFWLLSGIVFLYGVSGVGWNGLYHVAMAETAGQQRAATGVGLSMTLNQIGTFSGPPLFGFVADVSGSYQTAWLLMACVALAGTGMAALNMKGEIPRA